MVTIASVTPESVADLSGVVAGDILISINGNDISDVLDYRFQITEKSVSLLLHRGPELLTVNIEKPMYDDIGLEFSSYLIDEKRSCHNKCIFCFIDQNPPGMRDTIYFKDDDRRLSFLQGNYVTTTNFTEDDISRIIKMRCSPINISVHTTNPSLRCRMMNNRHAGKIMDIMRRLADGGIKMNAQIVLCKNVNDGDELDRSMHDLFSLFPALSSVSIVPAGLTKYREGLPHIEQFSENEANDVIDSVDRFAKECKEKTGSRIFFCSDEFYLTAKRDFPSEDYYEDYPQIENGVGLITSMQAEFDRELDFLDDYDLTLNRNVSIATGVAAYNFISSLAEVLCDRIPSLTINVYEIKNDFFGHNITVAGLVTGRDIISQLSDENLGEKLILPSVMLRADRDLFLDGTTPRELSEKLGVPICFSDSNGYDFIRNILEVTV